MADLFDYLDWRGDITFEQVPFGKIDALLLAHLSYSIFDGLISESFSEKKSLSQLSEDFVKSPDYEERINIGFLINKRTAELMTKCAATERFKDVTVCGYKNIYSEEKMEQFAAIVFSVCGTNVIAFRGTDDTITGWREDFNIAYLSQIPAQKDALDYFELAAKELSGDFIISGHSKGGNLAVNTAVNCGRKNQSRVKKVYNFDGPGFLSDFFEKAEYKKIEDKIHSVYPELSVVGMIFEHPKNFEITKSNGFAIMQHDALTWQIIGGQFDNADDFTEESKIFNKAFNQWVEKLSVEQRKKFVNALFDIIEASGAKTNTELEKNALAASAKMIAAYSAMDKQTKTEVRNILSVLKAAVQSSLPMIKFFPSTGAGGTMNY